MIDSKQFQEFVAVIVSEGERVVFVQSPELLLVMLVKSLDFPVPGGIEPIDFLKVQGWDITPVWIDLAGNFGNPAAVMTRIMAQKQNQPMTVRVSSSCPWHYFSS